MSKIHKTLKQKQETNTETCKIGGKVITVGDRFKEGCLGLKWVIVLLRSDGRKFQRWWAEDSAAGAETGRGNRQVDRGCERTEMRTEDEDLSDWSGDVKEIGRVRKGDIVNRDKCTEETTTLLWTHVCLCLVDYLSKDPN